MRCSGGIFEALNGKVYGNLSSGQTLVLSPSFVTTRSDWQILIPLFAYFFNFKLVMFDFAFSPNVCPKLYDPKKYSTYGGYADDLVDIMDELNIEKAIYIGHAMSTMIGCIAAVRRPDLFQHLILISPSPRYLDDIDYVGGFNKSQIDRMFKQMSQNYKTWAHDFAIQAIEVNDSNAISNIENYLMKMNPHIALSVAKVVFFSDWRSILPKLRIEMTLIKPKIDAAVPQEVAYYMMEHLGCRSNLKILDSQGDIPQLSAYVALFKLLRQVLLKLS